MPALVFVETYGTEHGTGTVDDMTNDLKMKLLSLFGGHMEHGVEAQLPTTLRRPEDQLECRSGPQTSRWARDIRRLLRTARSDGSPTGRRLQYFEEESSGDFSKYQPILNVSSHGP